MRGFFFYDLITIKLNNFWQLFGNFYNRYLIAIVLSEYY